MIEASFQISAAIGLFVAICMFAHGDKASSIFRLRRLHRFNTALRAGRSSGVLRWGKVATPH